MVSEKIEMSKFTDDDDDNDRCKLMTIPSLTYWFM